MAMTCFTWWYATEILLTTPKLMSHIFPHVTKIKRNSITKLSSFRFGTNTQNVYLISTFDFDIYNMPRIQVKCSAL